MIVAAIRSAARSANLALTILWRGGWRCFRGRHRDVTTIAQVCRETRFEKTSQGTVEVPIIRDEKWTRCRRCGRPAPTSQLKAWGEPDGGL